MVVQRFRKLEIKNILSVYGIHKDEGGNDKIYLIKDLIKPKDEANFLKNFLVFEIPAIQGPSLVNISSDRAKK